MHRLSGFYANRAPLSGRESETRTAEEAYDPDARSAWLSSATSSPRPSRLALCALLVAAASIAALISVQVPGSLSAQDGGMTDPKITGELVVVPGVVQVGRTVLAVGFHVVPFDLQVEIRYSGHFTPEGDSCDTAGTPGATQSAAAPAWITLNACTVGEGYVRLIDSANGSAIKDVSVTIVHPAIPGPVTDLTVEPRNTNITVSWVAPSEGGSPTGYIAHIKPVGGGDGQTLRPEADKTTVKFRRLDRATEYRIWVRAVNEGGKGERTVVRSSTK